MNGDTISELDALERNAAGPAGLESLRSLTKETPGPAPVVEHTEHARMAGDCRGLRRVEHRVRDQHAGARRSAGLIAQELVGHGFTPSRGLAEGPTIP